MACSSWFGILLNIAEYQNMDVLIPVREATILAVQVILSWQQNSWPEAHDWHHQAMAFRGGHKGPQVD
jgi:hypothetical protein